MFPSGTDLHAHPLLLNGTIILQDKASCFPAHILNPPRGAHIIDACAAPGNKTSHLASLIGNQGSIFAFDQDAKRLGTLQMLSRRAGCSSIEAIHQDFLKVNPNDAKYKNVEYILLDPSCSGSGIVSRLDHLVEEHEQQQQQQKQQQKQQKSRDSLNPSPVETSPETLQNQRLESLADFQYNAIIHAFKFPSIKRVVYSTCSRHEIENEGVVQKVLKKLGNVRLIDRDQVLPTWPRRGINGGKNIKREE